MATTIERERLRADLDADEDVLTDAEIDDVFARATALYGNNAAAIHAGARVVAIQQLLAAAAKRADSTQNASSERHAQVFDHLLRLRAIYEGEALSALRLALDAAIAWGGLRRGWTRIEEYPVGEYPDA